MAFHSLSNMTMQDTGQLLIRFLNQTLDQFDLRKGGSNGKKIKKI